MVDEGEPVGPDGKDWVFGSTQKECEQICDQEPACNSFSYQPSKTGPSGGHNQVSACYFKARKISGPQEQEAKDDYYTVYKSCHEGNNICNDHKTYKFLNAEYLFRFQPISQRKIFFTVI